MLNGLVVRQLSEKEIRAGLNSGKFLPSDFLETEDGWKKLKETFFCKKNSESSNRWMALFIISFILNILMLLLIFWQSSRIDQLIN